MSPRTWWILVGGATALRAATPIAVLAASEHDLPLVPAYSYSALNGDANGFYAAAREFLASFGRVHPGALAAVAVVAAIAVAAGVRLWRNEAHRVAALLVPALAASLVVALVVRAMEPSGAGVFGWPLVWAGAMLPYRAVGLPLDPDVAFVFGLVLSVAALGATTVVTALAGWYASGRRVVGVLAAWLFAVWPLLTGPLTGGRAWENDQWNVDVGLHLYTEPLSTMLVACAIALLLRPPSGDVAFALAGLLLGLATATKLTNGLVAAALVVVVAVWRDVRRALPLALGGLVWAPLVAAYWSLGYGPIYDETGESLGAFWSGSAIGEAWSGSLLYTPLVIALLVAGIAAGMAALRDRPPAVLILLAPIAVNVVVYSFYTVTALHPRLLYGALPEAFVLAATGSLLLAGRLRAGRSASTP